MIKRLSAILLIGFSFLLISSFKSKEPNQSQPGLSAKNTSSKITEAPQRQLNGRSVSLKVLQQRLKECMAKGNCPENILQLSGLTKVTGYVIDKKGRDLILIGKVDDTLPPLYLEDFVIALRNTWMKYAELRGNTYYYSNPGCSIDPDPSVLNEVHQTGNLILSSSDPERVQKNLNQWHKVCRQPQKVRVLGIPFDTRFSKVMVEADYYMKMLVDGSVTFDINGFRSLTDIISDIMREDIDKGRPVSVPSRSLNRFWFYPGENSFLEDKGIKYIKKSRVILLSEENFVNRKGEVTGRGRPNLLADKFAKSFSVKYSEIARANPVYAELEGLFRFVALTKLMKFKKAPSKAGITLDYLINQYPLKSIPVSRTLPGISGIKEFKHRSETQGEYTELYMWLPSCGGVNIDIMIKDGNIVMDKSGSLLKIKEAVLSARPSPDALYWDFSV